jgi:hypothetical protein
MEIINQYIPGQFPSFYKGSEGNTFVAFTKAYYEFLESSNNVIYHAKNLKNYHDVDNVPDQFLQYFKDQYLGSLPSELMVNPRLLIKHIQDLWRSTGTKRGYELLFRILFDEEIEFYFPGQNIFKTSNNTWVEKSYIEVSNSPLLSELIGCKIYSSIGGATALVEDYNIITINNKVINVLTLSNITGNFQYGEYVLSNQLSNLNTENASIIVGSLSAVSIDNGGGEFNLGDIVNISSSGATSIGRVSSVQTENGKVVFTLVDGGDGFSLNAQIQVTGGGGSGATFSIGNIINQKVYNINLDNLNNYYNTQMENSSQGFTLNISNASASFTVGEIVNSSANGIWLDFSYTSGNSLNNLEFLSNTTLGIANLQVIRLDNPSYVGLAGPQAQLTNANLVNGISLIGSTSNNTIKIKSVSKIINYNANGTVTFANSSTLNVNNPIGYFLPTSNIYGQTSNAHAYINSTVRDTNWLFPATTISNLDTPMSTFLTYEIIVAGKISSLTRESPGQFYTTNPTVSVSEPLIYQLQISDGKGGYLGGDANVVAQANNLSGIITSLQIVDSGYGFDPGEAVSIYGNGQIYAQGTAVVDGTGKSQGYFLNNQSYLSDEIYLQDSFYYQTFSYEILAPMMISTYQKFVTDIVHPVQMKLFGRYKVNDYQQSNTELLIP